MTLGQYHAQVPDRWRVPADVFASDSNIGRFVDVVMPAGVAVSGLVGGVVMDDMDGDGFLDLMVSDWGIDKQFRLLRNNGDGLFTDWTSGLALREKSAD